MRSASSIDARVRSLGHFGVRKRLCIGGGGGGGRGDVCGGGGLGAVGNGHVSALAAPRGPLDDGGVVLLPSSGVPLAPSPDRQRVPRGCRAAGMYM